jgi:hypothetical protein
MARASLNPKFQFSHTRTLKPDAFYASTESAAPPKQLAAQKLAIQKLPTQKN